MNFTKTVKIYEKRFRQHYLKLNVSKINTIRVVWFLGIIIELSGIFPLMQKQMLSSRKHA